MRPWLFGWCWHKWTRWHQFVYVEYGRLPGDSPGYDYVVNRTPMQERTCKKCGKRQEEKV